MALLVNEPLVFLELTTKECLRSLTALVGVRPKKKKKTRNVNSKSSNAGWRKWVLS